MTEAVPDAVLDDSGQVRFGTYRGVLPKIVLPKAPPWKRVFRRKRWIYTFVSTREIIALYAIVDLGYASNAFALVADRDGEILFDRGFTGLSRPFAHVNDFPERGLDARFRLPGVDLRADFSDRNEPAYRQRVQTRELVWLGELTAKGPPALTVISPVAGGGKGSVNVTQKRAALEAHGLIEVAGRSFDLNGGVGGIDYTNGYLARRTAWRWAFASGTLENSVAGMNLVEGFNDGGGVSENALFVDGELVPVGRARFSWNKASPLEPWQVATDDGAIDLRFTPIGAHREERDLYVVRSHFVQPAGHFSGTLRVRGRTYEVERWPGVTEDQDIVW